MAESNTPTNKPLDADLNERINIDVANRQSIPIDCGTLVDAVRAILVDHRILKANVSLAIVDDSTIHSLNRQYLQHDYPTDVLSFLLEGDAEQRFVEGEIIVSSETADRSAREYGTSLPAEILLYVVHGTLHLLGYDDKIPTERKRMREAERRYLRQFGIE